MKPKKNSKKNKQKILIRIAKTLGSLVIIGTVLLLIPLSLPRLFGYQTYNVISGSMEPSIPVGSLIIVGSVDPESIEAGDVITFYSNGTLVSHRVVENDSFEGKYVTKGDANQENDVARVSYYDLIGKVKIHIPLLGIIGEYVSTPSGKLVLVELFICSMLLHIVANRISYGKN